MGRPDSKKIALSCWDQSGIFGATCRHGFVLAFCEMRRSGELCVRPSVIAGPYAHRSRCRYSAKYSLAITKHTLDTRTQKRPMLGFDVGCTFKKTVASSALVGPRAREQELRVIVNAFHGWAHNRGCQISHHPLYTTGAGLEDFEGMERFFSSSNDVAGVVRYASRFHYLQAFDLHFQQWDEDKYVALSKLTCFVRCIIHYTDRLIVFFSRFISSQ